MGNRLRLTNLFILAHCLREAGNPPWDTKPRAVQSRRLVWKPDWLRFTHLSLFNSLWNYTASYQAGPSHSYTVCIQLLAKSMRRSLMIDQSKIMGQPVVCHPVRTVIALPVSMGEFTLAISAHKVLAGFDHSPIRMEPYYSLSSRWQLWLKNLTPE